MAAISLLAAASQMQRSSRKAKDAERLLAEHNEAIESAGGIVLRWELVNGDLMWTGNAARFLGISPHQVPSSFRDFRSYLHPEDALYNAISHTLRTSEQHVCWPIRLKDANGGWKAFALKGKISRDAEIGSSCVWRRSFTVRPFGGFDRGRPCGALDENTGIAPDLYCGLGR